MVNGASPGPAPAAQARASSSRLTPGPAGGHGPTGSCAGTSPQPALAKVGVEGALTVHPSTEDVRPARSASASSMQSPPANADAIRVIILSLALARPGARPRSRHCWTSSGRPRCWASGGRKEQTGISHQSVVVERDTDAVGVVAWQHLSGAPSPGLFCCYKTIIPDSEEHPLTTSAR